MEIVPTFFKGFDLRHPHVEKMKKLKD